MLRPRAERPSRPHDLPLCRIIGWRSSGAGSRVRVRFVDEDQHRNDRHVKAKCRLLAVPQRRLPHRIPLAANDVKTEKPHQKPEGRMSGYEAVIEEVRFAEDSPLEGTGFELSVPLGEST